MMKYCMDTSILIEAWVRLYPYENFETLWGNLDDLIKKGELIASIEVLTEIEKKEDGLCHWIRERSGIFVPIDKQTQILVKEILAEFPKLVDTRKNRSAADPFVIAEARKTNTKVVTFESGRLGSAKKPNIPFVCSHYGVDCINLVDLIKENNWKF